MNTVVMVRQAHHDNIATIMYYSQNIQEVLQAFHSSSEGLTTSSVEKAREEYGFNELPAKAKSMWKLFFSQFADTMVYILFGALAISTVAPFLESDSIPSIGHFTDAFVILAILLLNAVLGFLQEFKAEQAIEQLQKLSSPHMRIRRDGVESIIPSREVVPGDIAIVEAGDRIAADGRILEHSHVRINESSLTGESLAVDKIADAITGENVSIADQDNMLFSGTLVTRGSAEFVVTATGAKTEIGTIAKLVSETEFPETPLQRRMAQMGKMLGIIVIVLCLVILGIGLYRDLHFTEILLIAVSLAVSAVPEGLPAVVTVCLAMGVRRMVKSNALVRRLESLETLGSVTVICSDKTGTITQNKMTVVDTWLCKGKNKELLAQIGASCNRAQLPDIGDPTEIGLLQFAQELNASRLDITDEQVPFTSEGKYMQTLHGDQVFLKGAPEKIVALADGSHDDVLEANNTFADKGLRVLACAVKEGDTVELIGLIAMQDPPRPTVKAAIAQSKQAGIRTIMITGDNLRTAKAIAESVGIEGKAMHGSEIDQLEPEQLMQTLEDTSIFARVSPEHKLKILNALKEMGEIVAMSGDGVNDAPALKGAHVGIAMGNVGTEVAREASSIVLADDCFATIVAAVAEGRRIYDNIIKFVVFLLRTNFDELLFISTCMFLGMPLPYLALHILWINLMTDSLPALALGMEPAEPDVMKRPPRSPTQHLLHGEFVRLAVAAVVGFGVSFALYSHLLRSGLELIEARSVTMTLAIMFELFMVISMRSSKPIWQVGLFSNKYMIGAIAVPFALQFVLLFTPLGKLFHLTAISQQQWLTVFGLSAAGFAFFELLKLLPTKK